MKILSKTLSETETIAHDFAEKVSDMKRPKTATVIGLYGDLGAGKTTFTQSFAKAFGIEETVNSPTFVIEKIYSIPQDINKKPPPFQHFIHIDAYRLESGEELHHLGWQEIAGNPHNIIVIEWPEKIPEILPNDIIKIGFEFIDENIREITFV